MKDPGMKGSCHCGAIYITVPQPPSGVLQCNCSHCTKTGWIGGYWRPDAVTIEVSKDRSNDNRDDILVPYVQGDKTITVWHCGICGCPTHWTPITAPPDRMGVNMRIFGPHEWSHIPVTQVDGASL